MPDYEFANFEFLYLLIVVPLLIAWYFFRNRFRYADIRISSLQALASKGNSFKAVFRHILFGSRMLALSLLIVAFARPQSSTSWENITTEGIDIVLALDISASMLARDFEPNRLEASKEVAWDFIKARKNDRIGLVIFSGESFTQCPLTTDHSVIKDLLAEVKTGMIEDGTAIGMGLGTAVNRLRNSEAESKVVILLTDGDNNRGEIAPLTAAEIADTLGVRVYTIGVGTRGKAYSPVAIYPNGEYVFDYIDVNFNEEVLHQMAEITGGKYFRATSEKKLMDIYNEIDQLEKSKIEVSRFNRKSEEFFPFLLIAGILLFFDVTLKNTMLRTVP